MPVATSALKSRRVVDKILTNIVMGFDLDQEFSAHHLFPDVDAPDTSGDIIKFGKEQFLERDTRRGPGETVRSIDFHYTSDKYALEQRLLEAKVPIEFVQEMEKVPSVKAEKDAVNIVVSGMRLEGERVKARLATTHANYATDNTQTLSGTDQWSDPASDPQAVIKDAKAVIRRKTGRYPNVLHLDMYAYESLKIHPKIKENFKYTGKDSITVDMLASYFDIEKVVVAKAVSVPTLDDDFTEVWGNNTVLAYVAPKGQRSMRRPSFGYNYMERGTPNVLKGYFKNGDRSYHYPVEMHDHAYITMPTAGFLISNTAPIA